MTDDGFAFDLPEGASPQMQAIALLGRSVHQLRTGLAALADRVDQHHTGPPAPVNSGGGGGVEHPGMLRWAVLDHPQATVSWTWLVTWVGWLVERFGLHEELGSCWPQHPPLVEELGALGLAWQSAYDPEAALEAPLRWLEALARARTRWRDWDDHTRCRHGRHTTRRSELPWPAGWRDAALDVAEADTAERPRPTPSDQKGPRP